MKRVVWTGAVAVALLGVAGPVWAQGFTIYLPPNCDLDTQHFLVRNAELYVKAATESRSDDQRDRSIADAKRVLMDALEAGEETNPGVWYFLGRTYALESDLAGADSAFTKAEALYSDCAEDIDNQRRWIWVPLYNEGAEALGVNDLDAAREALTRADQISNKEPFVPYYLASVLLSQDDIAGALELFKKTVAMGKTEGDYEETYLTSLFNAGRLHHMLEQWDSAAVWYAKYRQVSPDDREAITGFLQVLEGGGHDEEALAFADTILEYADAMTDLDMFSAGVSLFQANRYETAVRAFRAGLEKNRHYRDGVYNLAQSYFAIANPGDSTETPTGCWIDKGTLISFGSTEQGVELRRLTAQESICPIIGFAWRLSAFRGRNSVMVWDHESATLTRIHVQDGISRWEQWTGVTVAAIRSEDLDDGLDFASYTDGQGRAPVSSAARAFLREHREEEQAVRDEAAKEMLVVTKRLQEIDPASEDAIRLLAAAYQLNGDTTATLATLKRIEALTFDVRIELFEPSESGYHVRGTIANLRNEETTVPDLVFEFLDIDGRVVTTETVFGQTLISKATDRFQLGPVGEGIAAWRYKAES